jgi:hypothetical protein
MKFRKSLLWPCMAMVFLVGVGYFLYSICYSDINHEAYQDVIKAASQSEKETRGTTKQQRQLVAKDIWFTREEVPLQLHLRSADSELVFDHHGSHSEIVEKMSDVICYVQEELFYMLGEDQEVVRNAQGKLVLRTSPSTEVAEGSQGLKPVQRIRYIEADNAIYYFQGGLLVANEVRLSQYILPGHKLTYTIEGKTPVMKGRAESLEISLLSKGLTFNAKKMTATF